MALAVEAVVGIHDVGADTLHEMPSLLSQLEPPRIQAIGVHDQHLLLVLQTARLLPEAAWQALESARAAPGERRS